MHVLVAPSGFERVLSAREAADAIARGVNTAAPRARVLKAPLRGKSGWTTRSKRHRGRRLEALMRKADLVITAEPRVEAARADGARPDVGLCAKRMGLPVIMLTTRVGEGRSAPGRDRFDALFSIADGPHGQEYYDKHAADLLEQTAEQALRTVQVGAEHSVARRRVKAASRPEQAA